MASGSRGWRSSIRFDRASGGGSLAKGLYTDCLILVVSGDGVASAR